MCAHYNDIHIFTLAKIKGFDYKMEISANVKT